MPILTLLISLFFFFFYFDARIERTPTKDKSTTDYPEYIIMDEEAP